MSVAEIACRWAAAAADDDSHGYDQVKRWGPDYDCSSLVITAFKQAGIPLTCTWTGDMLQDMLARGFREVTGKIDLVTGTGLVSGDVLLHEKKHTALYIGGGSIVNAGGNESGGTAGGRTGDQTGREIRICPYYNFPWEHVLRYEERAETPPPAAGRSCTVKPGDSLWAIAERELGNGYRFGEIRTLNGLEGYVIYPGQVLRLPGDADPEETRSVTLPRNTWKKIDEIAAARSLTPDKLMEETFK